MARRCRPPARWCRDRALGRQITPDSAITPDRGRTEPWQAGVRGIRCSNGFVSGFSNTWKAQLMRNTLGIVSATLPADTIEREYPIKISRKPDQPDHVLHLHPVVGRPRTTVPGRPEWSNQLRVDDTVHQCFFLFFPKVKVLAFQKKSPLRGKFYSKQWIWIGFLQEKCAAGAKILRVYNVFVKFCFIFTHFFTSDQKRLPWFKTFPLGVAGRAPQGKKSTAVHIAQEFMTAAQCLRQ